MVPAINRVPFLRFPKKVVVRTLGVSRYQDVLQFKGVQGKFAKTHRTQVILEISSLNTFCIEIVFCINNKMGGLFSSDSESSSTQEESPAQIFTTQAGPRTLTSSDRNSITKLMESTTDSNDDVSQLSKTILIELFNLQRIYLLNLCNFRDMLLEYLKLVLVIYVESKIEQSDEKKFFPWIALNENGVYIEHDNANVTEEQIAASKNIQQAIKAPMEQEKIEVAVRFPDVNPSKDKLENKRIGFNMVYNIKDKKLNQPIIHGLHLTGEKAREQYLQTSTHLQKQERAKDVFYFIYDDTILLRPSRILFTDQEFDEFKLVVEGKINDKFLHSDAYMEQTGKEVNQQFPKYETLTTHLDYNISFSSYRRSVLLIVDEIFKVLKKRKIHKTKKPSIFLGQVRIILNRFCDMARNLNYK